MSPDSRFLSVLPLIVASLAVAAGPSSALHEIQDLGAEESSLLATAGWSDPEGALLAGGGTAVATDDGEALGFSFADVALPSGCVDPQVNLAFVLVTQAITDWVDDLWMADIYVDGVLVDFALLDGTPQEDDLLVDLAPLGPWSVEDLDDLTVVLATMANGAADGAWTVDQVVLSVGVNCPPVDGASMAFLVNERGSMVFDAPRPGGPLGFTDPEGEPMRILMYAPPLPTGWELGQFNPDACCLAPFEAPPLTTVPAACPAPGAATVRDVTDVGFALSNNETATSLANYTLTFAAFDGNLTLVAPDGTVSDGGLCSWAELTLVPLKTPLEGADAFAATEDTTVVLNVLANDAPVPGLILGGESCLPEADDLQVTPYESAQGVAPLVDPTGNVIFTPAPDFTGTDTFEYALLGANCAWILVPVQVTVAAVNDAPLNTVPAAETVAEDLAKVFSRANGNALHTEDVDATTLRATLTATHGVLTLAGGPLFSGLTFVTGDGTADATVTVTGAPDKVNAALNGMAYLPDLDYEGAANITLLTEDLGESGAGGPLQDEDTVALTVVNTDLDEDGVLDGADNCIAIPNASQANGDGDALGDVCDPNLKDGPLGDLDGDGAKNNADAFDNDRSETLDSDGDGRGNNADNCDFNANAGQADGDGDGTGDACDGAPQDGPAGDLDGDGTRNARDDFPFDATETSDTDDDGTGNNADTDDDGDGVLDAADNCRVRRNPTQTDLDSDGKGDTCDSDRDGDDVANRDDLFPDDGDEWADFDADGLGDAADPDDDNDGASDVVEAQLGSDPHVADSDGDGLTDGEEADAGTDPTDGADPDGLPIAPAAEPDGKGGVQIGWTASPDPRVESYRVWRYGGPGLATQAFVAEVDASGLSGHAVTDADNPGGAFRYAVESVRPSAPAGTPASVVYTDSRVYEPCVDVLLGDGDADGICDSEEVALGLNPGAADSDLDGILDGDELAAGTDPLDALSLPADATVDTVAASGGGDGLAWWVWVALGVVALAAAGTVVVVVARGTRQAGEGEEVVFTSS